MRELEEIVAEIVPGSRVEYAEDAGPDKRTYRVDCTKIARTLPEFKPKWDARQGAQQLHEAYQKVGLRLDDFEGTRYRRIKHLKKLMANGRIDENLRWLEPEVA